MSTATAVNIVPVHGGFVDGSGWRPVYDILKKDGYRVGVVRHATATRTTRAKRCPRSGIRARLE
jgi:hypothetical protein